MQSQNITYVPPQYTAECAAIASLISELMDAEIYLDALKMGLDICLQRRDILKADSFASTIARIELDIARKRQEIDAAKIDIRKKSGKRVVVELVQP